jgi:hypothetical protein
MDITNDPIAQRLQAAKERLEAKKNQQTTVQAPNQSAQPENPLTKYYTPKVASPQPSAGGSPIPLVTPQAANPKPVQVPQPRFAKPDKSFLQNAADGLAVGWEQMKGTTARGLAEMLDLGATTPSMGVIPGIEGQPKFGDYSKLKKDQAEGKRGSVAPGLTSFADTSQKKAENLLEDRKADPESWGFMVGSLLPQGAGIATAVGVGAVNPIAGMALGAASTGQLTSMAIGGAAEEYDTYIADNRKKLTETVQGLYPNTIENGEINLDKLRQFSPDLANRIENNKYDPNARLGSMMLSAAAESISEAIPVAKFVPKQFRGQMAKFIFGNTEVTAKKGAELIQEFAKSSKSRAQLVKNLTREAAEGALVEGPTEAVAELGNEFSTWLYKEKKDRATFTEMAERAAKAVVGGSLMGGAIGPMSYGAQQYQNRQRRQQAGKVVLAQDKNSGEALEIMGVANPSKKTEGMTQGPAIYQAIRPNGKIIEISEYQVGTVVEMPLEDFNGILKGRAKAETVQETQRNEAAQTQAAQEAQAIREQFQPLTFQGEDGTPMISAAKFNGEPVYVTATMPDGMAVIQKPGEEKKVIQANGLTEIETYPFEEFITGFAPQPQAQFDPANPIQKGEEVNIDGTGYVVTGFDADSGLVQLENIEDASDLPPLMPVAEFQAYRQPPITEEAAVQEETPVELDGPAQLRQIFAEGDQVDLGGKTEIEEAKALPKATEQTAKQYEDIKSLVERKLGVKFDFATVGLQKEIRLNNMREALKQSGEIGQELADIIDFPSASLRFLNNLPDAQTQNQLNNEEVNQQHVLEESPDGGNQDQAGQDGAQLRAEGQAEEVKAKIEEIEKKYDEIIEKEGLNILSPISLDERGLSQQEIQEVKQKQQEQLKRDQRLEQLIKEKQVELADLANAQPSSEEQAGLGQPIAEDGGKKPGPEVVGKEVQLMEIERRKKEDINNIGKNAVQRRLQDLREAENEKQTAKAILDIEKNVRGGGVLTKQEQDYLDQKKNELKQQGFEIIDHNNKVYDSGLNIEVKNVKNIQEGETLSSEQIEAIEKELASRKRKKEKLKEKGLSEKEIEVFFEDHIMLMDTIDPQINKDGKMVKAAKVNGTVIEINGIEDLLERSKKNPNDIKKRRTERINAKYDAELAALNQPTTPTNDQLQQAEPDQQAGQEYVQAPQNQENSPEEVQGQEGLVSAGLSTEQEEGNPAQYEDIDKASTADQLAKLYDAEIQNMEGVDPIESAIADHIGKINPESFARFGDRKNITQGLAANWIAKKGTGKQIDLVAQEASEQLTPGNSESISPEDVVNFLYKFNSASEVTTPKGNPKLKAIQEKYTALTGKSLNRRSAKSLTKKAAKALKGKSVTKDEAGVLLETDTQIADYLAKNPEIMDFLTSEFGTPSEDIFATPGEINYQAALDELNSNPSWFTVFPGGFNVTELDAIRTILKQKINAQSSNARANPSVPNVPATPSADQSIPDQQPKTGQADTPSPRTPSSRNKQEPNTPNPDNAGEAKPSGSEGTGSNIADGGVKKTPKKTIQDLIQGKNEPKKKTPASKLSSDPDAPRFSIPPSTKNLVVLHNIKPAGLANAIKLGGLPVPSIAITNVNNDFNSYGDITLIGDKDLIDPSDPKNKVFNADIYSPRYPSITYTPSFKVLQKEFDDVTSAVIPAFRNIIATSELEQRIGDNGPRGIRDSQTAKAKFMLEKTGKLPDPVVRLNDDVSQEMIDHVIKKTKEASEREGSYEALQAREDGEFIELYRKHTESQLRAKGADESSIQLLTERYKLGENLPYTFSDVFWQTQELARGKKKYDEYKFKSDINNFIVENQEEFNNWADQVYERLDVKEEIFRGYTPSGNRKYAPHELSTVVRILTEKVKNGENFNYGAGNIRAAAAKRFKSILDITKDRDKLISKDQFESLKEESNNALFELMDELKPNYRYESNSFGYYDNVSEILAEHAEGKRNALSEGFKGLSKEQLAKINDYMAMLRDMPTEYFEAKPQRAVELSEFSAAVVPDDLNPKLIESLRNQGVTVYAYDSKKDGDRKRAIQESTQEMDLRFMKVTPQTEHTSRLQELIQAPTGPKQTKKAVDIAKKAADFTKNWSNAPKIVTFNTAQEALDTYPELAEKYTLEDLNDVPAIFIQNPQTGDFEAVLIASHSYLSEKGAVEKAILHEVIGHYGVRAFLKAQAKGDKAKYLESFNTLMTQVFEAKQGDKFLADIAKRYFAKPVSELNATEKLIVADEYLAHVAQDGVQDKWIDRVVAKFRQLLRELGISVGLSDSEIRALLGNSMRFVAGPNGNVMVREGISEESAKMIQDNMNAQVINGFYSPIEKRILDFKQPKASATKWKEIVGKKDEAQWTGIYQYLDGLKPDQQVTKKELLDWMKDNRVEIREIQKTNPKIDGVPIEYERVNIEGNLSSVPEEYENILEEYDNDIDAIVSDYFAKNLPNYWQNRFSDENYEAWNYLSDEDQKSFGFDPNPTNYENYQLEGDKTDYKEVLVTLPSKANLPKLTGWNSPKEAAERAERAKLDFKSSHFDEPNILVHLRMNTRTAADGSKVLFLEEVQSDWGQQGKKVGFQGKSPFKAIEKNDGTWDVYLNGELKRNVYSDSETNAIRQAGYNADFTGTPSAPFVTDTNSWIKLGLKVAIKEAVAQGADRIAWTTGTQQNERYDLSKQVDEVQYRKPFQEGGKYQVLVKKGSQVIENKTMPESDLEAYIGKEVAQKIVSGEGSKLDDVGMMSLGKTDLKIGGKGMNAFYGDPASGDIGMVGRVAESIVGKGMVGTTFIDNGQPSKIDAFQYDGTQDVSMLSGLDYLQNGDWIITNNSIPIYNYGDSKSKKEAIELFMDEIGNSFSEFKNLGGSSTQHSIQVTPELVDQVERGLPMFMRQPNQDQTQSPAFKAWFGDSKVVDSEGKPLVVYHGTDKKFTEFTVGSAPGWGRGIYFTDNKENTIEFGERTIEAYLSIQKPVDGDNLFQYEQEVTSHPLWNQEQERLRKKYDDEEFELDYREYISEGDTFAFVNNVFKELGYDGIIANNSNNIEGKEIVVFSPTQIKSATGNNGDFNPDNADIRFMKVGATETEINTALQSEHETNEKTVKQMLKDNFVDKMDVVQRAMDKAAKGRKVESYQNPVMNQNVRKSIKTQKLDDFTENYFTPIIEKMASIIKTSGVTKKQVSDYLQAKHHEERKAYFVDKYNKEGKKLPKDDRWPTGWKDDEANQVKADFESKVPKDKIDDFLATVKKATEFTNEERFKTQMITEETYNDLKTRYNNYVPLNSWEETEQFNTSVFTPLMSAKGRTSKAADPIPFILTAAQEAIVRGQNNMTAISMLEFAKDFVSPKQYSIKNAWYKQTGETNDFGEPLWVESTDRPTKDELANGTAFRGFNEKIMRYVKTAAGQDAVLPILVKGKRVFLEFSDVNVAKALKNRDVQELNKILSWGRNFNQWLSKMWTQYSPVFGIVNFIRDAQFATFNMLVDGNSPAKVAKIFTRVPKAMFEIGYHRAYNKTTNTERGKLYQRFLDSGGLTGYADLKTIESSYKEAQNAINLLNQSKWNLSTRKAKKLLLTALKPLDIYNRSMENAIRFSYFQQKIEEGKTDIEASFDSKNVSINFNKMGSMSPQMGAWFIFFNAAVQGNYSIYNKFSKAKTRRKAIQYSSYIAAAGLIHGLLHGMMGEEDDKEERYYDQIPDYVKRNNMIIPNPFGETKGDYLTIPLPYGLNVFWGIGLSLGHVLSGSGTPKEEILGLMTTASNAFSPIGGIDFVAMNEDNRDRKDVAKDVAQMLLPSYLSGELDIWNNRTFSGFPVYRENYMQNQYQFPDSQMYLPGVNQFYKGTTDFLNKATGGDEIDPGWIDLNPSKLEHRINTYFGGPAKFLEETVTTSLNLISGEDFGEDPIFNKVPFAKRFYKKSGTIYQERSKFYETAAVLQNLKDRLEAAINNAKPEKADEIISEDPVKYNLIYTFDAYNKEIKKMNKYINEFKKQDEDQFSEQIDKLYDDRDQLMKKFNDLYFKEVTKKSKKSILDIK